MGSWGFIIQFSLRTHLKFSVIKIKNIHAFFKTTKNRHVGKRTKEELSMCYPQEAKHRKMQTLNLQK